MAAIGTHDIEALTESEIFEALFEAALAIGPMPTLAVDYLQDVARLMAETARA